MPKIIICLICRFQMDIVGNEEEERGRRWGQMECCSWQMINKNQILLHCLLVSANSHTYLFRDIL